MKQNLAASSQNHDPQRATYEDSKASRLKGEHVTVSSRALIAARRSQNSLRNQVIFIVVRSAIFSKLSESDQLSIVQSIAFTIPSHRINGRRGETSLRRPCLSRHCGLPNNIHKNVESLRQVRCFRKSLQLLED
jgi:hypothetical protein